MKAARKAPSGTVGFDKITGGGLPGGRTTLLVGGPGSGKTIFALQFLLHGAEKCEEPGIFVAFEESAERILANAESFGWPAAELQSTQKLFFLDAQPKPDMVQSGDFDLSGMIAALEAQITDMKAQRIVFDALDVVLALLPDPASVRREIYRLHTWLLTRELTGIITLKEGVDYTGAAGQQPFGFMQFMVDCAVILNHCMLGGVSQRNLRVQKYRGSSFDEDETPFLISSRGFEITVADTLNYADAWVNDERISSGIDRLDTMLGGGYFRGACVLITGSPGTAKTTLSGAFAEAACRRGERTLFVCFDTNRTEVIRNLSSVGIDLEPYVSNSSLLIVSARTIAGSAETYLVRIKAMAREHGARCVVVDPVSSWSKSGSALSTYNVAERLIDWSKSDGTTLLFTSLYDEMSGQAGGNSPLQLTTVVDTWIHLNYLVQAGERNRGLSIIKSRGTEHSNQVREIVLSNEGMTLTDTYTAGGEVLMGTLRWEKEGVERDAHEAAETATKLKTVKLDAQETELEVRIRSLRTELKAKRLEKALLARTTEINKEDVSSDRARIQELRGADEEQLEEN